MRQAVVLCYHALSPTWRATLSVTPHAFGRQISYLIAAGWKPVTFSELAHGSRRDRLLAITFDDAFASVRDLAAPILAGLDVPATVFAPTAFMDGEGTLEWPGVDHWRSTDDARELAAMDWADLRRLADSGWEIGSHTCTHPHLTSLDDDTLASELTKSRERCSEQLRRTCRSIAYPFGDVDRRVRAAAARAGYTSGAKLARNLRNDGPHGIPRIGIYNHDTWARFRLKLAAPTRIARASLALRPS